MGDRPIRDRTLVLRVLVPGLETRLRDKMKEAEERAAEKISSESKGSSGTHTTGGGNSGNNSSNKDLLLDLEGVTCEPTTIQGNTLWNFHCDGAKYPARLVNLPCPVELHKTHDHVMYYKCTDVAQMLIVYEDSTALAEAEDDSSKIEGFPSYYHSGLTPALKNVVERRFAAREHSPVAPPRQEVSDVEEQLVDLMERISKEGDAKTNKRSKVPALTSAALANKVLEEVEEEIVDYEAWMDDFGRQPQGLEFDADDQLASLHPEVWLVPEEIREIRDKEAAEAELKKKKAADKKQKKNKKEKQKKEKKEQKQAEAAAAAAAASPKKKKGIASKKNTEEVDEVTQAAASMLNIDASVDDILDDDDLFGDFDFTDDAMDLQL